MIDDHGRVERIPYELCVLVALRDAIRRREVFIEDAHRWRDPDHYLEALGMADQQIQRYEANDYRSTSLARERWRCRTVGVTVAQHAELKPSAA